MADQTCPQGAALPSQIAAWGSIALWLCGKNCYRSLSCDTLFLPCLAAMGWIGRVQCDTVCYLAPRNNLQTTRFETAKMGTTKTWLEIYLNSANPSIWRCSSRKCNSSKQVLNRICAQNGLETPRFEHTRVRSGKGPASLLGDRVARLCFLSGAGKEPWASQRPLKRLVFPRAPHRVPTLGLLPSGHRSKKTDKHEHFGLDAV